MYNFNSKMLGSVPNEYDRSRYLLVSLILANMGNVEIEVTEKAGTNSMGRQAVSNEGADMDASGSGQPLDTDKIRLKLLKLERHHQAIFHFFGFIVNFRFLGLRR